MPKVEGRDDEVATRDRLPYRIRLPGFIIHEDVGLGDLIKHATSSVGIRPCGGCQARAAVLNRMLTLSRRGSP